MMCRDVLHAPLYCKLCAEEEEVHKHHHFPAKKEVLAQPTKYRNRNLEKIKHQMNDGTDFVVMPQLSDSSVYSQCSVDTKGRTRWEREAQEMFPEIVDQPQGDVGRDGGLACASKIDDDSEKEVQRLAWLQFRKYSHRLQKQEERYERPRLLAPKLS